jgi:Spy/CpxP family protein refolding chaperone
MFRKMHGPGGKAGAEFLAEHLDLNAQQKESLEKLLADLEKEAAPLMEEARTLHTEIHQALEAGNPDATAIGEKVIAMHALHTRAKAAHDVFKEKLGAILTEEQRKELQEMHERMHMRHFEGGPGMHFGFGH